MKLLLNSLLSLAVGGWIPLRCPVIESELEKKRISKGSTVLEHSRGLKRTDSTKSAFYPGSC